MEKLVKSRKPFISVTMLFCLSLFVMLISPISSVFASERDSNDDLEEMADDMEFIFEEVSKEENGEIILGNFKDG